MNRKQKTVATLVLLGALSSAACARRAPGAATPDPNLAPVATPAPQTPPNAAAAPAARGTLAERLSAEAQGRPATSLSAERVTEALSRAGLALGPLTQVLGRTIGARYCASTATPAGLGVAVCEFADDAEAARGLDYSHRTFDRLVPGRTLLRNRGTVLTLTPGDPGAANAPAPAPAVAEATRAATAFAAL